MTVEPESAGSGLASNYLHRATIEPKGINEVGDVENTIEISTDKLGEFLEN